MLPHRYMMLDCSTSVWKEFASFNVLIIDYDMGSNCKPVWVGQWLKSGYDMALGMPQEVECRISSLFGVIVRYAEGPCLISLGLTGY